MLLILTCEICGKGHQSSQKHKKTCSVECRDKRTLKIHGRYSDKSIPTATAGAISEIVVAAELMKNGFHVFRSLSPSCPCDLIAIKNKIPMMVEVKTGYFSENERIYFPATENLDFLDFIAVYVRAKNEIFYFDKERNPVKKERLFSSLFTTSVLIKNTIKDLEKYGD